MASNFAFLDERFHELAQLGELAEGYLYTDPNSCIYKLGVMAENIVKTMIYQEGVIMPPYDDTHASRISKLKALDALSRNEADMLHVMRKTRNEAAHNNTGTQSDALTMLQIAFSLCCWFMQVYGDYKYEPGYFIVPQRVDPKPENQRHMDKLEADTAELANERAAAPKTAIVTTSKERRARATKASSKLLLSESETRALIDGQLREVNWEADTERLRYSNGTRPQNGRSIAIAEWPTDSKMGSRGFADYALFYGLQLIGIVEAKQDTTDILSVLDYQCKDYAQHIKIEHNEYVIQQWGNYQVPFLFATNGKPYARLETKAGLWFRDARSPSNSPRALQGWISPDGLKEMLGYNTSAADDALRGTRYDLLSDPNGLRLRKYQIDAIEAVEHAIMDGKKTALLAMATGTGKTRTAIGMIYRFLEAKRFRHVLFLVDRRYLGEQANDAFRDVKISDLLTLNQIYNIKPIGDYEFEQTTRIQVSTVQSLVNRVLLGDGDAPPVSDYDLIIIDEAHRGYTLNKEMGDDEQLFRSEMDYISKYRAAIEYFDAFKVALTATPALHTKQIFGEPVFSYSYRQAVIEGNLIDHDAPHNIMTRLRAEGIHYKKGDTVAVYDPDTREILNSDELEDEMNFDVDDFNKKVITEGFNRAVFEEIAGDLNPDGPGKTLIFAANDAHADLIVKILKEIYTDMGYDNDAVAKITGSVCGGDSKKISEEVKKFKNEKYPTIVVTVDLLTTGVDIESITTLVFMRRVRSRILYEQMLGRATRQCPAISKDHFEIYDPVGLYELLEPVTSMKPVVQNVKTTFDDLVAGLDAMETDKQVKRHVEEIAAKVHRYEKNLTDDAVEEFVETSGGLTPSQFAEKIINMDPGEVKAYIKRNSTLFDLLNDGSHPGRRRQIISFEMDELRGHTRDYGGGRSPEDYIQEFNEFISDNVNNITALNVVVTRPKELTRSALISLRTELDKHSFSEAWLKTAWRESRNEDIAADIIGFIRQSALGSPLISHEERVHRAVNRLKKNHSFDKLQQSWLEKIEKALVNETVVDRDMLNTGAFASQGGFARIDKIFKGRLDESLQEIKEYLYDDGGMTA